MLTGSENEDGKFMWPGFRDKEVLRWIVKDQPGGRAHETPWLDTK